MRDYDQCTGESAVLVPGDCRWWQAFRRVTKAHDWTVCGDYETDPCACEFACGNLECGVGCHEQRITGIWLPGNNVSGTLPNMGTLDGLRVLSLYANGLHGTIPDLSALSLLESLELGDNALSGTIPNITALTALALLRLNNNMLTGPVPHLATQTTLQVLALQDNTLTGAVPDLAALTALQQLWLYNNTLTGPLPDIGFLTQLQRVSLFDNDFSGTIPRLDALTGLVQLTLHSNAISGTIPPIHQLTALQLLGLNHNRLVGSIPRLSGMRALRDLFVGNNFGLSGTMPSLASLRALESIIVFNTSLTGTIPALQGLTSLRALAFIQNRMSGSIPALQGLTALEQLLMYSNGLQGTIPPLNTNTALKYVHLYNNSLDGTVPPLHALSELGQLLLHSNNLRGVVPVLPSNLLRNILPTPLSDDDDVYISSKVYTRPAVTLFNNRLSCVLPNVSAAASPDLAAIVAFGNRFSAPAPSWVHSTTRSAQFLFVPDTPAWYWVLGYLGVGAVLMVAIILCWARKRRDKSMLIARRGNHNSGDGGALMSLQRDGAYVLAALACLGLVTLLPTYSSGANYYECGYPLMHTSLAYIADAPRATVAAVVLVVFFAWASVWGCRWIWVRNHEVASVITSQGGTSRFSSDVFWPRLVCSLRPILGTGAWLLGTAILSAPTVLYVMSLYLPRDNALGITGIDAAVLRRVVPFLLAMINAAVLPWMTRLLVRKCYERSDDRPTAPGRGAQVAVACMLLLARLLTTVVLPVAAVLVFGEGCGDRWRSLWLACSGNNTFWQFDFYTGCHGPGCDYFIANLNAGVALSPQQLCAGTLDGRDASSLLSRPQCVRSAIEALAPLIAEKIAIAALLQPALLLLAFESGSMQWIKRVLCGQADGNVYVGLDFEFAAIMTQFDVALIYGLVLPIVLPIAALSMATHWHIFSFLQRERGIRVLPCASPPVSYLQATLLMQAALATWFFSAVEGAACGAVVGTATLPVSLCWLHGTRDFRVPTRAKTSWPTWLRRCSTAAASRASTGLGLSEFRNGAHGSQSKSVSTECMNSAHTDGAAYTLMSDG